MLSAKEIDVWICECGKENEFEDTNCKKCNKDTYGFVKNEKSPNDVLLKIKN